MQPPSPAYYTAQYSTFTSTVNNTKHCYYSANMLFFIIDLLGRHDFPSFLPTFLPFTSCLPKAQPSCGKQVGNGVCHTCNKCARWYFAHAICHCCECVFLLTLINVPSIFIWSKKPWALKSNLVRDALVVSVMFDIPGMPLHELDLA